MAYIRLAPDDPARWHVPLASVPEMAGPGGAVVSLALPGTDATAVLEKLDAIALATPHTLRLAGSPAEGRITWVTRSILFGFPDYTTAEVRAEGPVTIVRVWARLRFGRSDFGVNAARLRDWMRRLASG